MFKIVDHRTFTHDVKVLMPKDGGFEEDVLRTTFNYLPTDEARRYDLRTAEGTTDFLKAAILTFDDLVDADGTNLICTVELRDRLLLHPNVRQAVIAHYFDAVTRVKEGN